VVRIAVVEQEEVELMCVFVLDGPPGKLARVEQVGIDPELSGSGRRSDVERGIVIVTRVGTRPQ